MATLESCRLPGPHRALIPSLNSTQALTQSHVTVRAWYLFKDHRVAPDLPAQPSSLLYVQSFTDEEVTALPRDWGGAVIRWMLEMAEPSRTQQFPPRGNSGVKELAELERALRQL